MADTLSELLGSVTAYQKGSEAATQQVLSVLATQANLSSAVASTYQQQATDDSTVAAAKNAADYATQLSRVKAANAAGANLKNSTEVISSLSQAANEAFQRKQAALAEIERKKNINFLDHPIDYIAAQFTVEDDISRHNAANAVLQATQDRINAINTNVQATIVTQNAISEPLTAASMEASARSAAVAATVASKNAEINSLSYGTRGIEFALNAKKDVLALGFQANQAQNAEKQIGISLQQLDLSKKEFSFRQQEWEEKKTDREDQRALGQSVIDTVNLGRKALLGANAAALDDMNGKMILATLKGKGTLSTEMQKYYDAGERTRLAGSVSIGTTPAQAAETMQAVPVQLNPTQGPIKNLLSQAAVDTSTALKNSEIMPGKNSNPVFIGLDKKDKNSINSAMNGRAQQLLNESAKEVKPGDGDNPYQIGSINQLAEHSPTIQALPVYQKVLAPLVKSGVLLNDPKQIVSVVGDAVASGAITHAQALELTTIYHVGVGANLAMRNFPGFGLVPSRSYNARVETNPNAFTSTEVVDLTRPDQLSRALVKIQSARLQEQLSSGEANIFTGKKTNSVGTIFNSKGNDPSSVFQPAPGVANSIQSAVDNAGSAVDRMFNNLPHSR